MNIERWLKLKRPGWERLEELVHLIESTGGASLSRLQWQEFGRLYRLASSDLSYARSIDLGGETQVYLNNLVVKAHNQVYQTRQNRFYELGNFLWSGFPALVRQYMAYICVAAIISIGSFALSFSYVLKDIHFAQLEILNGQPILPEDIWHTIEQGKMWTDSSEKLSPLASSLISTHNIRVAVSAFVLGITFGIGTVFILCQNGLSLGTVYGVCHLYNMDGRLLAFIAPHAVLELSSIFISGGAGLLIGKALLFPGTYRRLDALKLVIKDALGLFGGCMPLLLVAGLIEGFVSPRTDLAPFTKYALSLSTLSCLLFYIFIPRTKKS